MNTEINGLMIEFIDGCIKIDNVVVSFRGTESLYNEIVNDISNLGCWYKYGITLKK
jgi:hypothetical protein